jgi:hypothetical protein
MKDFPTGICLATAGLVVGTPKIQGSIATTELVSVEH